MTDASAFIHALFHVPKITIVNNNLQFIQFFNNTEHYPKLRKMSKLLKWNKAAEKWGKNFNTKIYHGHS